MICKHCSITIYLAQAHVSLDITHILVHHHLLLPLSSLPAAFPVDPEILAWLVFSFASSALTAPQSCLSRHHIHTLGKGRHYFSSYHHVSTSTHPLLSRTPSPEEPSYFSSKPSAAPRCTKRDISHPASVQVPPRCCVTLSASASSCAPVPVYSCFLPTSATSTLSSARAVSPSKTCLSHPPHSNSTLYL